MKQNICQKLDEITNIQVQEYYKFRYSLLTDTKYGLTCRNINSPEYYPFLSSDFIHKQQLGDLSSKEWQTVLASDPNQLITVNPFEKSAIRQRGYKIWDAAIGIPSNIHRNTLPTTITKLNAIRNCNKDWIEQVKLVNLVNPLRNISVEYPYMVDITQMSNGWRILEAAHVLAHMRGDLQTTDPYWKYKQHDVSTHFIAAFSEICFALMFNIPLDVSFRQENRPGRPDFAYWRFEVKASTNFKLPYLKVPVITKEAMRPDETLAVVSIGVYIGPPPSSFLYNNDVSYPNEHFCNMPLIAIFTGWEMPDIITHQQLIQADANSNGICVRDICYGVHPADQMPPSLFWIYLKHAYDALGRPEDAIQNLKNDFNNVATNYMYVNDWLNSDYYKMQYMNTPPLPCKTCIVWNDFCDLVTRPKGIKPKPSRIKNNPSWVTFLRNVRKLFNILTKNIVNFEIKYFNDKDIVLKLRKIRRQKYNKKLDTLKLMYTYKKLYNQMKTNGSLSVAKEAKYKKILNQLNEQKEQICYILELIPELMEGLPLLENLYKEHKKYQP